MFNVNMYTYIAVLAYFVILFLTLRDIRIYRRTRFDSYRKGAVKGIIASTLSLIGILFTTIPVNVGMSIGMLLVLMALFLNQKGTRENVFEDARAIDRFLGKTDI